MGQYEQTRETGAGVAAERRGAEDRRSAEEPDTAIDARELLQSATEAAKESPHAALAAAFAVGFLLGGGLTPRLLVSLAIFAGRKYVSEAARDALQQVAREQIEGVRAS